ncbi:MAG: flagellar biosynthesis protein FlgL [Sulfuricurvum sp.]|nr:flagellar biosynthesis protein FlgL [Sulfuricurvum sp.]MDP3022768.1 flagellar biosynthesis protein FlgL [Sulfuricurvum sp.]MDP3119932.1 flagellar biosynthesis protein FlgL [Sulfuricurvum sp.]
MRVTAASFYNNIYGENNKLNRQLFDVNKQISSGLKIQYSHENPGIFIDTLRLDNEIATLNQTKSSAQNAYKLSTQTDTAVGEIVKTLESMKVKMINAANDSQSDASLQAIAKELRGLQNHLKSLANTSINGQYIFSGTSTGTKPIDASGNYQGNDKDIYAFLGSGIQQKYNITGTQLFLGQESNVQRTITSNVGQLSLTDLYPDIMQDPSIPRNFGKEVYISGANTMRDLMGDSDTSSTNDTAKTAFFYLQGTRSDGTSFKSKIAMNMTDTVDDLMNKIALAYDINQLNPSANNVRVSMNPHGQIEIIDSQKGSSKLDFHMVGAIDFDPAGIDAADVTNIDSLQIGTTDFLTAAITAPGLFLKEFIKSGNNYVTGAVPAGGALPAGAVVINGQDIGAVAVLPGDTDNALLNAINAKSKFTGVIATHDSAGQIVLNSNRGQDIVVSGTDNGAISGLSNNTYNLGSLQYDRVLFKTEGPKLTSNVSQIVTSNNSYATPSTLLTAVASGVSLNGSVIKLQGNDVNGKAFDLEVNLLAAGSTVTINNAQGVAAATFNLEDATGNATPADSVTYRQLMDVLNMATTNKLPVALSSLTYTQAINDANALGSVNIDQTGHIVFFDKFSPTTSASIAMYDNTSSTYSAAANVVSTGSTMIFNANNALTIGDPNNDFFTQIESMIKSVEQGKKRPNGIDSLDPRNIGVQNSIHMLDLLTEHVSRKQTEAGSYSQVLNLTVNRAELLIVNTKTLRSDVIDTDIAEATLKMQQLSLNYQALLSNISKVSKLSLVNYL